ncbi:hypothetical protein CGRA01v4_04017 [Colletotrichum graminicola]|nr:hypothetical protein CGRA01v4_04017 [Colletotrichum graminicola]
MPSCALQLVIRFNVPILLLQAPFY